MQITTLRHIEMAGALAVLRAVVSSIVEVALCRSPNKTFQVEVVSELVAEFQKLEEWSSFLEQPGVRICDLLLGPPSGRVRLADRLEEAVRREVDTELEALRVLAMWV
jgi:hypothetical protein